MTAEVRALMDVVRRSLLPSNPNNAEKIPWDEPGFSTRMLENHLSQEHDWASRKMDTIATHCAWVHDRLGNTTGRLLDLACGPGFYTYRLAESGHTCTGVDFSPASIAYASERAASAKISVHYLLEDIRKYTPTERFDCVLLIFGEINVFTQSDASNIIQTCAEALKDDGFLVMEAHTLEAVQDVGMAPPTWERHESGLFSPEPHLLLQENVWNAQTRSASSRYYVIDASTGTTRSYGSTMQGYEPHEYEALLQKSGFVQSQILTQGEWPSGDCFVGKLVTRICCKE